MVAPGEPRRMDRPLTAVRLQGGENRTPTEMPQGVEAAE